MSSHLNIIRDVTKSLCSMRGISVHEFGEPKVCQIDHNLTIPEPTDDQIQIRVHVAGVNPLDTYIRAGTHAIKPKLPYIPGYDAAGVISKIGRNVSNFSIGDRVWTTLSSTGTYSEYTLGSHDLVFKLNDNMSFAEGSALGIPYFTAYRSLFIKGNAKPGEVVMIHGASGSTGNASIQIAKANGLIVAGTAGTDAGLDLIKSLGADYAFNHSKTGYLDEIKQTFPDGVDLLLEMSAHNNLNNDLGLVKTKGRIIIIGCHSPIEINPRFIMHKEALVTGVSGFLSDKAERKIIESHLQAMIKIGCIKPVLAKSYRLEEAAQAHHDIIVKGGLLGKISLQI